MKYFYVEPEVAGGLGSNTVLNHQVHLPIVSKLQYTFDVWLGDELLEGFPCFIVTENMQQNIQQAQFSGVTFDHVEVTASGEFEDLYGNKQLPTFMWLRVVGTPGKDDFGTVTDGRLVVSERALRMLQDVGVSHALVKEFPE
jgi:hypothetical protein